MTTLTGVGAHTPLICTFRQLARPFLPLHQMERRYLDTLHDVWKRGAPTPNSRITQPKGYDERLRQRGNYEARIVPAPWLAACQTIVSLPPPSQSACEYHSPWWKT